MKKRIGCLAQFIIVFALVLFVAILLTGCGSSVASYDSYDDVAAQAEVADRLSASQQTPTDIDYSLERYNLIRRAYWVNGQHEKANTLVCPIEKPLSYVALFTGNTIVGKFVVDGKVSSLNSYLTPSFVDDVYGGGSSGYTTYTTETADVDGSYGENDAGIFFFTPEGNYFEWTGTYLYSDVPFEIADPVVSYEVAG